MVDNVINHWNKTAEYYLGSNFREVLSISETQQFNVLLNILVMLGILIYIFFLRKHTFVNIKREDNRLFRTFL